MPRAHRLEGRSYRALCNIRCLLTMTNTNVPTETPRRIVSIRGAPAGTCASARGSKKQSAWTRFHRAGPLQHETPCGACETRRGPASDTQLTSQARSRDILSSLSRRRLSSEPMTEGVVRSWQLQARKCAHGGFRVDHDRAPTKIARVQIQFNDSQDAFASRSTVAAS